MSPPNEGAEAAAAAALRILGGAAQSRASLRRRLVQRGFSDEDADSATDAATRAGYVDDAALAESIVARRRGRRGSVRIVAELRARGVENDVARAVVGRVPAEEEREAAVNEARRRVPAAGLSVDRVARRRELGRIAGALNRLGFPSAAIAHALAMLGSVED
jgi:regulatory protein